MASIRTTFTLNKEMAEQARQLDINISAAARSGVAAAIKARMIRSDRAAYQHSPEQPDTFWREADAWTDE